MWVEVVVVVAVEVITVEIVLVAESEVMWTKVVAV